MTYYALICLAGFVIGYLSRGLWQRWLIWRELGPGGLKNWRYLP